MTKQQEAWEKINGLAKVYPAKRISWGDSDAEKWFNTQVEIVWKNSLSQIKRRIAGLKDYRTGKPEPREDYDCDCGYGYDDCSCERNRAIDDALKELEG